MCSHGLIPLCMVLIYSFSLLYYYTRHGLILLPVLLSLVGPKPFSSSENSGDYTESGIKSTSHKLDSDEDVPLEVDEEAK